MPDLRNSPLARALGPGGITGSTDPGRGLSIGGMFISSDDLAPPAGPDPRVANLDAQAAQDAANAEAEKAKAAGLAKEADAYRIAAGIAGSNATLEQQATAITRFQQQRQVRATVAGQRADVAAAGFKESGSALSLMRESVSQGAITDALTAVQGNLNAGGYRAQQAAGLAEEAAVSTSSEAATALAKEYAAAGVLATSQSANLAAEIARTDDLSRAGLRFSSAFGFAGAGGGGVAAGSVGGGAFGGGFRVRSGGSDPFLEGGLTNPAYTGLGGGGGIGTGTVQGSGFQPDAGGHLVSPSGGGGDAGGGADYGGGGEAVDFSC